MIKTTEVTDVQKIIHDSSLTKEEIIFNRISSVLLFISTPFILYWNFLTIPTVVIIIIYSVLSFFVKKHLLIVRSIFFLLAIIMYFIPLPIGFGLFLSLREFKFSGYDYNLLVILFLTVRFLFISLVTGGFLVDILSFFKIDKRKLVILNIIFVLITGLIILAYPLLTEYKLREKAMEGGGTSKLSSVITKQELVITEPGTNGQSSSMARRFFTARYDSNTKKYIYQLNLPYPLEESLEFTNIQIDGEKIKIFNDPRIECTSCQTDKNNPYHLTLPIGQSVNFVISSNVFIKEITFIEENGTIGDFIFWK